MKIELVQMPKTSMPPFLQPTAKAFFGRVADGYIRVIADREPFDHNATLAWHVSVSHSSAGAAVESKRRRPTDEEMDAVAAFLLHGFHYMEDNDGSRDKSVRHLWEIGVI